MVVDVCRSEVTMSILLIGATLSAILTMAAILLASPNDPDGFNGI